jgi:hypothetical protein
MNAAPKIIDIKMEEVSLHQAENAWKPNTFKETPTAELSQVHIVSTTKHFAKTVVTN